MVGGHQRCAAPAGGRHGAAWVLHAIRTPWPVGLPGTPASPWLAIYTHSWCMRSNWADWGARELLGDLSGLSQALAGHYLSSFKRSGRRSGGGGRNSGKKRRRCGRKGELGRGGGVEAGRARGG